MRDLSEFILSSEDRLIENLFGYAKEHGYVKYTSTLFEAWRLSVSGLSKALASALETYGHIPELSPDEDYGDDPCAGFGILEAQRHRERGISLSMFLGLLKYYRQSYIDLIVEGAPPESQKEYIRSVNRFFDRLEIGICSEWTSEEKDELVDELRKTNRFLTNEKNKYLTLVESIPSPVILLNYEGRLDSMNLAAARLLKKSARPGTSYYCPRRDRSYEFLQEQIAEDIGDDCLQGASPDRFLPWLSEEIESFLASESGEIKFRKDILMPEGARNLEISLTRMPDMSERYAGVVITMDDATELISANEALRLNKQRLEAVLELSEMEGSGGDDLVSFTLEKAIELTNSRMGYLAFVDETESVMTMHALSRNADQECRIQMDEKAYSIADTGLWGEAVRRREPVVTNDYSAPNALKKGLPPGHPEIIRHMNVPIFEGDRIVAVAGVGNKLTDYDASDVLQLKLLMRGMWRHLQRLETAAELKRTFGKLSTIVSSFPGFIHIIDREHNLLMASEDSVGPKRVPKDLAIGRKCYEVFKNEDEICANCDLSAVFEEGFIHSRQTSEAEAEIFGKHYKVYTTPIKDENGDVNEAVEIFLDVSDMKAMENRLMAARDEAMSASRSKSEFLANMSHEVRTPLNGVMGMLQLLETTELTDEQAEFVKTGINSGNSLIRVISDILDLSRIEAGKIEIAQEEFNLASTLDVVMQTFHEEVRRKGISLYYEFSPAVAADYIGDETRLRQILFNLVGNAVKFTSDGEIRLEAWPIENDRGEFLLFSVEDTGMGISEDKLDMIFEPFSQADGSYTRKYQGSGLGLAIVSRLVGLMGGSISLESEPGRGTTLHFTVQVCKADGKKPAMYENTEQIDLDGFRVIVAEDNEINRMAAVKMLEAVGCNVLEAEDGSEVLALLAREEADLILMDVQMPRMDGVLTTRTIRSGAGKLTDPDVPIVAMTAHAMSGDKEKFLEAGMNDYIAKPVDMQNLARVLSKYKN